MTGSPRSRKTFGNKVKDNVSDINTLFHLKNQNHFISTGGILSGSGTGGISSDAGKFLIKAGDSMLGPIAYFPQVKTISAGVLDISSDTGAYSSYVIASGEGAANDDLVSILGGAFSGQFLLLQGITGINLTIKHLAIGGNIRTPDGADFILLGNQQIMLYLDPVTGPPQWVIPVDTSTGGGGLSDTTYPVDNQGNISGIVTHSLSLATKHELKFTAIGNCTLVFTNYPASGTGIDFYVIVTQDATGGRIITFPPEVINPPVLATTPNIVSIVALHTDDGGAIVRAILLNSSISGGVLPAGLAENDHLEWNAVSSVWESKSVMKFGTLDSVLPQIGFLRFPNATEGIAWRNFANTADVYAEVNASNQFNISRNDNQPMTFAITGQHATDPDNVFSITQYVGATTKPTEFTVPQVGRFFVGAGEKFNFDTNRIETLVNILPISDAAALSVGSISQRFNAMYSTIFGIDLLRTLAFATSTTTLSLSSPGGGTPQTFRIDIDGLQRLAMNVSLTDFSGNAQIQGTATIGSKIELVEIAAPGTSPAANRGWIHAKDVGGTHSEPFWKDELGNVTSMLSGGGGTFSDNAFAIFDNVDPTKIFIFQAANITTGTTRTLTVQNSSGVLAMLEPNQSWSGVNEFNNTVTFQNVGSAAIFNLKRIDTTPNANDTIAIIDFIGNDSLLNQEIFARIKATQTTVTNNVEESALIFETMTDGLRTCMMTLGPFDLALENEFAIDLEFFRNEGLPVVGDIGQIRFKTQNSVSTLKNFLTINVNAFDISNGLENSVITFTGLNSGASRDFLKYDGSGGLRIADNSAEKVSFFGSVPIAKPTITGSRGGNAALTSLLTALANFGQITNSTTA